MASNEEILDTLGIIQNHIISIESSVEEVKMSKQEAVEMNENDRNVILKNISTFEKDLVDKIVDTIVQQQLEIKSENEDFKDKLLEQSRKNRVEAENLFNSVERTKKNVHELNSIVSDSVNAGFNNLHLREEISKIMNSSIKSSLENQTKANQQAVIDLGKTAENLKEKFNDFVFTPFAFLGMLLIGIACYGGFKIHEFYQKKTCENVFEQFYSERFNEELAAPLKEAEIKAKEYLDAQKKTADEYRKQKVAEADEYYKARLEEAKKDANDAYEMSIQAFVDNAKKDSAKTKRKNNTKEDN